MYSSMLRKGLHICRLGSKQTVGLCALPAVLGEQCCPPEQLVAAAEAPHGNSRKDVERKLRTPQLWHP